MKLIKNEMILSKTFLTILIVIALIIGCVGTSYSNDSVEADKNVNETQITMNNIYVQYSSHVQGYGWETDFSKSNGQISGTTGQNKKVEAVKIKLINAPENVNITYQSYLTGIGWQDWVKNGQISGTTGQDRKIEGIKIKLDSTEEYSVEYCVHVQKHRLDELGKRWRTCWSYR